MGRTASGLGSHPAMRLALAGCLAGLLAGCADSDRLADPFSNPFHTASRGVDRMPTGSVGQAAPTMSVQSRPLAAPISRAPANGPLAAYAAPSYPSPRLASAQPMAPRDTTAVGWSATGGMPVVVAQGETSRTVAKRYGIPEDALLRTNGFSSAMQVRPGTRLIIPVYNAALAASSGVRVASRRPTVIAARVPEKHAEKLRFVKGAQPADRGRMAKVDARHERIQERHEKLAQEKLSREKLAQEKLAKAEAHRLHAERRVATVAKPEIKAHVLATEKIASAASRRSVVEPTKPVVDSTPTASLQETDGKPTVAAALHDFRWPAHGRIIEAFKKGRNDGINIALPEGTSVHAAEAGVVAYAGNELKGYGNLILIRHPNGFVTAYANNAAIEVKRGQTVRRGEVIAKSGQTGNVSTPQLHFELRKGSKPVDPRQYLATL